MTFNPFPWHRPSEAPSARRVEPLPGAGLGNGRTVADRPTIGMVLALTAGAVAPLAVAVLLFTGLPWPFWVGASAAAIGVAVLTLRRARSARARPSARAEARGLARRPDAVGRRRRR